MATPRRMLGRSPITQYVTLEGLELLTGVASENFDLLVLKELVDNALDAWSRLNGGQSSSKPFRKSALFHQAPLTDLIEFCKVFRFEI